MGLRKERCERELGSLRTDGLLVPSLHLLGVQSPVRSRQDQDAVFTSLTDRAQPVRARSAYVGEPGEQAQPETRKLSVSIAAMVCSSLLTALDSFPILENLAPSPVTFP